MGTLLKRTVFGLLYSAILIGCMLVPWGILVLVCFLSAALFHEFYRLTVDRRFRKEMICLSLGSLVVLILLFFHFQSGIPVRFAALGFLPVMAAFIFLLFDAA